MSDEAALGPLPRASAVDQGEYRYFLARCRPASGLLWPIGGKRQGETACFVTLNPSTADAMADDPTIRRCQRFAWDWGFDRLSVVNLFALRATDPKELHVHPDPVGPERVRYCRAAFGEADLVVCAWGATALPSADVFTLALIIEAGLTPHVLRLTKHGAPAHPLDLPEGLEPVEWETQ